MLSSFDSPSRTPSGTKTNFYIIPLRIGAGLSLLYLHGWTQAIGAWQHLWNQAPWDAVGLVEKAGLPLAQVLAVAGAAITAFTAVSWILGFVTRFSSMLFLPVTALSLLIANRTGQYTEAELCVLYFLIALTLICTGSGWIALDTFFGKKREKKRW
jgi:uncharacterized membrane protein YphA (DoxX/SURF4 family)